MPVTFDPPKRDRTLAERGLDFADAERVLADRTIEKIDDRRDYGETRFVSVGRLTRAIVVLVWTWRDGERRIISMRHADAGERDDYQREYGEEDGVD